LFGTRSHTSIKVRGQEVPEKALKKSLSKRGPMKFLLYVNLGEKKKNDDTTCTHGGVSDCVFYTISIRIGPI